MSMLLSEALVWGAEIYRLQGARHLPMMPPLAQQRRSQFAEEVFINNHQEQNHAMGLSDSRHLL
jgi:hypothetical protein